MTNFKTPGVYIREISRLPASVAPVATAVPAFVGYTERALKKGEDVAFTPVRITSLLEYEEIFGRPFPEQFGISLSDGPQNSEAPTVEISGDISPYILHYCMQLYFANGGGPCYIVSVGIYEDDLQDASVSSDALAEGLKALENEDEPTILVIPETVKLEDDGDRKTLYDSMLDQCADLKDRFAILDAMVGSDKNPFADGNEFRDQVGMNNLMYGGAYYPSLKTLIRYAFNEWDLSISDTRSAQKFDTWSLRDIREGVISEQGVIVLEELADLREGDTLTINGNIFTFYKDDGEGDIEIKATPSPTATEIAKAIDGTEGFSATRVTGEATVLVNMVGPDASETALEIEFTAAPPEEEEEEEEEREPFSISIIEKTEILAPDKSLYNLIKKELDKRRVILYPSSAMAGLYAKVDRDRGVWKAPANVSVSFVSEPTVLVTHEQQEPLNVDPGTGKSVNVIRKFNQKGTLVWGARTLAGNDNEWRYVPVRRLFIFLEESIKKATEPVVFEPNDANTWSKTKGMIENFLTGLWREGALAGATTQDAFFVKVGLGQTMSAIDILEGRLIIEVGVAAVRPAEFIILKFMHKLQES